MFALHGGPNHHRRQTGGLASPAAEATQQTEAQMGDLNRKANKNRTEGVIDEATGRIRSAAGELTGDESQQLKGKGEQLKGKAKQALGDVQDSLDDSEHRRGRH